ncbi:MAG: dicarboxylate/amino acid:cation symporter [Chthonomonadales bacterium]|nr:dicarboxylate/amino acid:cation symporter [Chthonomonadales bacterium]
MSHSGHALAPQPEPTGPFAWYQKTPLFIRILVALAIGVVVGEMMGHRAEVFKPFSSVILRLLGALATPLILLAVIQALYKANVTGRTGLKLVSLLLLNTVVAILVGLLVANVLQPGNHTSVKITTKSVPQKAFDPVEDLLGKIPGSVLKPLSENDIIAVIIISVAVGIGLRVLRARSSELQGPLRQIEGFLDLGFELVMVVLHWIIALVPFAVFGVVAQKVGTEGINAFKPLLWFIVAVLLALAIQACYYLLRIAMGSWVRPKNFIHGASEALLLAFSTASSAATLPITYKCMREKIGVREESASLGIMVGGAFNHDGTALYEAMAALFISQLLHAQGLLHTPMDAKSQLIIVFMSVTASVGAAGIPEAGLVTMMAVFTAVRLPVEYIPMLLVVDWFLDRCRTAINVMGDMSVTCLLDGKTRAPGISAPEPEIPAFAEPATASE